jgi:4-hydroxybenzoyl-CoA reductase subunit beta
VRIAALPGWRSTYWKLRRRGAFDFPVLSVAAAAQFLGDGTIRHATVVVGAVASCPVEVPEAGQLVVGTRLDDDAVAAAAERAAHLVRPMDNTDFTLHWRKKVTRDFVAYALRELRGDDMRAVRRRIARHLV